MTCDIIIPIFNQVKFTRECVESIRKSTSISYRIIIIDDNSNDPAMVNFLGSIGDSNTKVIHNLNNLGWVKSVNRGLDESSAEYICVMNNDTIVTDGWLAQMIAVAKKQKDIGLVNPEWEKPQRVSIQDYAKSLKKLSGEFIETDFIRGFCFLIKRDVLDKIGGLDEDYSPGYYDDCDFSLCAIKAGFRCVRAKAAYVYHHRNISYSNAERNKLMEKNKGLFYKRWGRPLRILFVFNKKVDDPNHIEELIYSLLRNQHHLYIWLKDKEMLEVSHTNAELLYPGVLFFRPLIFLAALNNAMRNINKRYDVIFTNDDLLIRMLSFFKIDKKISTNLVDFDNCSIAVKIGAEVENKRDERKVNGGNNN